MPLGPGVTPVDPAELLTLFVRQLSESGTGGGCSDPTGAGLGDLAFLSLWPDDLHLVNPRGDKFVAVRPARFPVWQSLIQGSGQTANASPNNTFGLNTVVSCLIFIRQNSDPEMRSTNTLTQDALSTISFILKVVSSLQFWMPVSSGGAYLLREPARLTDGGFGINPVSGKDGPWVKVSADFSLNFEALLPTTA
jgi:hypothetical protein